jgi:hypothetical protein
MDIESVVLEVKRVLAPGGVFLFAEEPLLRLLSLRLYHCPYQESMKPWERALFRWGLLGYLVRDVIGAAQEESFGIRQNHSMYLNDWHALVRKHFVDHRYHIVVPERGWGERLMKKLAVRLDPCRSVWRAAHLLGGTLAASCKKEGGSAPLPSLERFEEFLQCPDCRSGLTRPAEDRLICSACGYSAANEGRVFNLLPSADRDELYPGDRDDAIDFSLPGHAERLIDGWYELEGVYGNRYRWIGPKASARLRAVRPGRQRLRIRGHAHELAFRQGQPVRIEAKVNGQCIIQQTLDRPGLFVVEADAPEAPEYTVEISASPSWSVPDDDRIFTVIISMIRLVPAES